MQTQKIKKLDLIRETVRHLSDSDLDAVYGAWPPSWEPPTTNPNHCPSGVVKPPELDPEDAEKISHATLISVGVISVIIANSLKKTIGCVPP